MKIPYTGVRISKELIALAIVFSDLLIGFILFFAFRFLKVFQEITENEIEESMVTANDFAVEIRGMPSHNQVLNLKADIWQWVEQINLKSQFNLKDPKFGEDDLD